LLAHQISISPIDRQHYWKDVFGNTILSAQFSEPTDKITIDAAMEIEAEAFNPFDFTTDTSAATYPFSYSALDRRVLSGYLSIGSPTTCATVLPWVRSALPSLPGQTLELLTSLNQTIHKNINYQKRDQAGIQSPDETIAMQSGSCRDLAVLMIEACRQLGFAARFVSGYLVQPNAQPHDGEQISLHAWIEVYLPGAGWISIDPTNGIFADAAFIPCAAASEPYLTNPVQGTYSHCKSFVPSELGVTLTAQLL
jgi:transglutaminase-like putative cysteine protease